MRVALAPRMLLVAVLATGFCALQELDSRVMTGGRGPLPALAALSEALYARGESGPGALLDEIMFPVWPGGADRERLRQRAATVPEAKDGRQQMDWEERLAEEFLQLPAHERLLLWSLTLEPGYPEGLRDILLRILDSLGDPSLDLARVVEWGERSTAWEAAVRLGRRGQRGDAEVLEEAVRRWRGWGRQYAILGLVLLHAESAVPTIREAVSDSSPAVRRHVALALGEMGDLRDHALLDQIVRERRDEKTVRTVHHARERLIQRHRPSL